MKSLNFLSILLSFSLLAGEKESRASLDKLMEGNQRYINEESIHSGDLGEKRKQLLASQSPFAIIIGCSDSRVPPEIVFDQSLGDIFVIRVAGNVVGPIEMDSIEFSADKLQAPLILVLGHQGCGAVNAVLQGNAEENDLESIAPLIQPAVDTTRKLPGDPLVNAIKENIRVNKRRLEANPILKSLIKKQNLKIVGGYYELDSGVVEILP